MVVDKPWSVLSCVCIPLADTGIPPSGDPDSYVLPAAISAVAVLLMVVLIGIFVVVICIITRRHNTRKSLEIHRLSIHYRSNQRRKSSDVNFKDNHLFVVDQSAELPIHDTNGTADEKSNNGDIRDTPHNYTAVGPSESNHNVVQGAAEETVAEGYISRPASQASIHSNEVSSKLTYGKVIWVHPSTLDHPYDSCNKEITMAASGGGGHYETSPHWQLAEETFNLPPDCRAVGKHPAGEVGEFPPVSGGTAGGGVLGLLQKCHSNPPKPSYLAQSVGVPQENHIYSVVEKSRKKSASSGTSPQAGLMNSTDATHVYSEVDKSSKADGKSTDTGALDGDFWGGSGNAEGDAMTQPQSITSSTTAKGAVSTQEVTMGDVYAEVDYSKKKKSKKSKKK